ncbi:MAG: MarR family transcriptional regulator [Parachlamydiaceae bacterium]|nr:MAG: MarR family transcriptional regulator [Parachlamydiaceae bacterium]
MKPLSKENINLFRNKARCVIRELGLLNDAYFDIDVTLSERHLLIELNTNLYPTMKEISEKLLLDKSTVSRLISKAVKKGYVKCSSDQNDKRKRYIYLSEKGKNVLDSFEQIAFNQTKQALQTLSEDEIQIVYRGMALYAKGLETSRRRNAIQISRVSLQDYAGLAQLMTQLNKEQDWDSLKSSILRKEGFYYVIKMDSKIIGGAGIFPNFHGKKSICEIKIFIFYLN